MKSYTNYTSYRNLQCKANYIGLIVFRTLVGNLELKQIKIRQMLQIPEYDCDNNC